VFVVDGRSFAPGGVPWLPAPSSLWLCNHLATDMGGGRYRFDYERAEREVGDVRVALSRAFLLDVVPLGEPAAGEATGALAGLGAEVAMREAGAELAAAGPAADEDDVGASAFGERGAVVVERDGRLRSPPTAVPEGPRVGRRLPVSQTGRPVMANRASGARCRGCAARLNEGAFVCAGGAGFVHNSLVCFERAERALREAAPPPEGLVAAPTAEVAVRGALPAPSGQSEAVSLHRVQMEADLSPARCEMVQRCVDGQCGLAEPRDMVCLGGCGARLHGVRCAQLSKGHASMGVFLCVGCRLGKQFPGMAAAGWPDAARRAHGRTMVFELATSAEGTGGSFADLTSLVRKYLTHVGQLVDEAAATSPFDDVEVLKAFFLWVVTDRDRALSLTSLWRAAGAFMAATGRTNLTRDGAAKAFYARLADAHGEESHPRTAATPRMMRLSHEVVLPERFAGKPVLLARGRVGLAGECAGGLRVGEMFGGGDGHGLLAPDVRLLREISSGEVSVEFVLRSSKTKYKRFVNTVDVTAGDAAIPVARYVREYIDAVGFSTSTTVEGGYEVTAPDYHVLRVSLIGMSLEQVEAMLRVLELSRSAEVRRHAGVSRLKGLERYHAVGSKDKRYVNVVGGPSGCEAVQVACLELQRAGFGGEGRLSIIGGPFGRATHGALTTHMPIAPRSVGLVVTESLARAFELANAESPDPKLDLRGLSEPRWGDHSYRRGADTSARGEMANTGADEKDIDLTFGWQERMYSQKMQFHYESSFTRVRRKAVTSLL